MTPESIATKIIKSSRGKVLTDVGARKAIEDGIKAYGEYKYKQGMRKTIEIAGEIASPKVRQIIINLTELI